MEPTRNFFDADSGLTARAFAGNKKAGERAEKSGRTRTDRTLPEGEFISDRAAEV
jgi:hypothetical protein